jgi:hypothetical protein
MCQEIDCWDFYYEIIQKFHAKFDDFRSDYLGEYEAMCETSLAC